MATYNNTLIFIGNGAKGTKKTDEFNNNLTAMGLSHYFAVTKEGEKKYKTISSEKSRGGGSAEAHTVYNLDPSTGGEQAFAERLDKFIAYVDKEVVKKGIKRDGLVDDFGKQYGFLPPKLKLRSVQSGALQIVLNYNIDATSNNVEGTGRIQFVENRGAGALSSAIVMGEILIKNGKYNFVFDEDKTTKDAAVAAVKANEVMGKLGVNITFDKTLRPNPPPPRAIVTPQPSPPGSPRPQSSMHATAAAAGAQRQIEEQVNLASAAAAAANASADKVEIHITNSSTAGGGESEASKNAKRAKSIAIKADEAVAMALAAKDNNDLDAVNAARAIAETAAKDAETAAKDAETAASNPFNGGDAAASDGGGKKRKTHRKKAKKNKSKRAKVKKTKAKKAKGGRTTLKRRRNPKRGKC